jgi:uncharacterized protein (TIGR03663 family)
VSTASTRSRNRKKKGYAESTSPRAKPTVPAAATESSSRDLSERSWRICSLTVMIVAAILRLYQLNLVPMHHDEGVNGNFLVHLVREGIYHYDPANYHGPTIYYFAAIIPWALRFLFGPSAQNTYGLNTVTVRLVPALFGIGTIWLVLLLRRQLGTIGALSAAALLATSPGAVYLSRYFIHEPLFVFFTLGVVVAGLRYYEEGSPVYLFLASVSAALLFATKETAIISAGVLVLALMSKQIYLALRNKFSRSGKRNKKARKAEGPTQSDQSPALIERLGGRTTLIVCGLGAIAVFIGVNVLLYSSFFTNYPKGVYDALKTFEFWTKTGKEAHVHPVHTYVLWLLKQESPVLFLGTIGAALVVWKPEKAFALFAALWAFGVLAAYSLISYKTPWLDLNFIVPLALIGGYALQVIYDFGLGQLRLVIAILFLATAISGYQAIDLNFFNYDNDDSYYVYVYAHSRREMLGLLDEINRVAQRTQQGGQTGITIVSPDYWPLPWYLRDYSRVGYHGQMTSSSEPIVIASESQGADVQTAFGDRYQQVNSGFNSAGSYPLRPGVNLLLYVRRDVLAKPSEH